MWRVPCSANKAQKQDLWQLLFQLECPCAPQDQRIAAVEAALGFLGSYTELGGSFLARRFRQEAWPQLQRLLQRGPDTPLNASEALAPAVVHRAQLAVVTYLQRCASPLVWFVWCCRNAVVASAGRCSTVVLRLGRWAASLEEPGHTDSGPLSGVFSASAPIIRSHFCTELS